MEPTTPHSGAPNGQASHVFGDGVAHFVPGQRIAAILPDAGGFAEVGLDAAGLTFVFPGVENRYRLSVSQRAAWRSPLPSGWRYQRWWATHRLQLLQLQ